MTAKQSFEAVSVERNKVGSPSMLLQEFNYYINKAISQRINKYYAYYDITQQSSDDLRVLKATTFLTPTEVDLPNLQPGASKLFGASYEVNLPLDYLHLLNCICVYTLDKNYKCYKEGDSVQFAAKRLTADAWPIILEDYYNRPRPERPYYYIHNINTSTDLPTNPVNNVDILDNSFSGTDAVNDTDSNLPRIISLKDFKNNSTVNRVGGVRYGNPSNIRMEIRCGDTNSPYKLTNVFVDYIKVPQTIHLTQRQVDSVEDTSQILEFPDSVCYEIINELVHLVMEQDADPRLQTHIPVTASVVPPVQQQT